MKRVSKRSQLSRPVRKKTSAIPATLAKLIEKAWPDGIVEMPIDEDESYFWDIYDKLKAKISKVRGVSMFDERPASTEVDSIDDEDENGLEEAWRDGSRSYHLFVIELHEQKLEFQSLRQKIPGKMWTFRQMMRQMTSKLRASSMRRNSMSLKLSGTVWAFCWRYLWWKLLWQHRHGLRARSETEYGTDASPPVVLPCAFDSASDEVEPDHRSYLSAKDRKRADAVQERLVRAVEETGLTVLPFDQRKNKNSRAAGRQRGLLE